MNWWLCCSGVVILFGAGCFVAFLREKSDKWLAVVYLLLWAGAVALLTLLLLFWGLSGTLT